MSARRQAAMATPAAVRQMKWWRAGTRACFDDRRARLSSASFCRTSEVKLGDAVARGRLRNEVPICLSFMVLFSLPPGCELSSEEIAGPGNARLHRSDADLQR